MAAADLTGVRKSAILLLSLGQDQASEILRRLPVGFFAPLQVIRTDNDAH